MESLGGVDGILAGHRVDDQQDFLEINAELAEKWPNITEMKDSPDDAEEWDGVPNKKEKLAREW